MTLLCPCGLVQYVQTVQYSVIITTVVHYYNTEKNRLEYKKKKINNTRNKKRLEQKSKQINPMTDVISRVSVTAALSTTETYLGILFIIIIIKLYTYVTRVTYILCSIYNKCINAHNIYNILS